MYPPNVSPLSPIHTHTTAGLPVASLSTPDQKPEAPSDAVLPETSVGSPACGGTGQGPRRALRPCTPSLCIWASLGVTCPFPLHPSSWVTLTRPPGLC